MSKLTVQRGFTLIELVMVIVIVGILSAIAIPKFAALTTQANVAANQGVAGALKSAVGISHALWIANGAVANSTITLEGTSVTMSTTGYPEYTTTAGTAGTMTNVKCEQVWNGILNNPPAVSSAGVCTGTCVYTATAATNTCTYTNGSNSITYNIATGAVTP